MRRLSNIIGRLGDSLYVCKSKASTPGASGCDILTGTRRDRKKIRDDVYYHQHATFRQSLRKSGWEPRPMIRRTVEEIIFRLSMRAHTGNPKGDLSHRPATFSADKYDEWRSESLRSQFEAYFDWGLIEQKRVLDFGCGTGPLSMLCAQHGARNVVGIDVMERSIARAKRLAAGMDEKFTFILEDSADCISLPDNSVDVILCFDVMEHVMNYQAIVAEWARVLAPGGCVLIWWSVWWHPYGHHMHTMIPLPWVHVFMSDESLFRVCARIYDTPQFQPRIWHFDDDGKRKPNPYTGRVAFDDLNKLTVRRFDRVIAAAGLRPRRKEIHPFTGSSFSGLKKLLAHSPLQDFFCSCAVYELEKPGAVDQTAVDSPPQNMLSTSC